MTGWNMPPGCNVTDIPGNADEACEVCFKPADACICPECPKCGMQGNLRCYGDHFNTGVHLKPTREQILCREAERVRRIDQSLADAKESLRLLSERDYDWDPSEFRISDDGL